MCSLGQNSKGELTPIFRPKLGIFCQVKRPQKLAIFMANWVRMANFGALTNVVRYARMVVKIRFPLQRDVKLFRIDL